MKTVSAVIIEVEKGENRYQFVMPVGAKFGEAYDVAMECGAEIWNLADKARKEAEAKAEADKKSVEAN